MSESPGAAGQSDKGLRRTRERTPLQHALIWVCLAAVSYGLTLTVISDTFFWFAIPGLLGLLTAVMLALHVVLNRSPENDSKDLVKRYAAVLLVAVVMVAGPMAVDVRYLYPFVGIGMMTFIVATKTLFDRRRAA
ncbi:MULTISPECIES: hypothetical protein [unclassified Spirillospora]|uniref:hypothetical protein n=1 Tax=unclassified Spirillospora TaxID=2642701 RepID=UPI00371F4D14